METRSPDLLLEAAELPAVPPPRGGFLGLWQRLVSKGESFESLLQPHIPDLYGLAHRLTGRQADAEDLVQAVLIKLYPDWRSLLAVRELRPWLARVVYNAYVDQWRRARLAPLAAAECEGDPVGDHATTAGPAAEAVKAELGDRLTAALDVLPAGHRDLLILHDVQGYTMRELETVLMLPLGTVKSRLFRARARLRQALGADFGNHFEA